MAGGEEVMKLMVTCFATKSTNLLKEHFSAVISKRSKDTFLLVQSEEVYHLVGPSLSLLSTSEIPSLF